MGGRGGRVSILGLNLIRHRRQYICKKKQGGKGGGGFPIKRGSGFETRSAEPSCGKQEVDACNQDSKKKNWGDGQLKGGRRENARRASSLLRRAILAIHAEKNTRGRRDKMYESGCG